MLPSYPNIILLSGTARNVGKTTFVCRLMAHFRHLPFTAVKVSPHWHDHDPRQALVYNENGLFVMREQNRESSKDTSRMLRCGAQRVYYVQHTNESMLMQAFHAIMSEGNGHHPLIFESAILGKFIRPGLHFRISRDGFTETKKIPAHIYVDRFICFDFDGRDFDIELERIRWKDGSWTLA